MSGIKFCLTKLLGIVLILIGTIGLFLPFLQGILMIMLGGSLLLGKRKSKKIIAYFKK